MSVAPTPDDNETGKDVLVIDFAGEIYRVEPTQSFTVGREGDLALSDNPFLHRKFLVFEFQNGLWWVHNQGSRLGATVADMAGASRAWVTPGVRVPMVFGQMAVVFSAGSTTYEILAEVPCPSYENREPAQAEAAEADSDTGQATMGMVVLTESQKLLILSLAEPWLRRAGTGTVSLPRNDDAVRGVQVTYFYFGAYYHPHMLLGNHRVAKADVYIVVAPHQVGALIKRENPTPIRP